MITQERLKEVLDYNPETGAFMWKATNSHDGSEAGGYNAAGYVKIKIDQMMYFAHRLAILYTDGYMPEGEVDHINRIKSDNRRKNLREASRQCQVRNCGMRRDNTSGIKGVSWHKPTSKWRAKITVDGQQKFLGHFDSIIKAAYTRYAAEQCLGFQDCDAKSSAKSFLMSHINGVM